MGVNYRIGQLGVAYGGGVWCVTILSPMRGMYPVRTTYIICRGNCSDILKVVLSILYHSEHCPLVSSPYKAVLGGPGGALPVLATLVRFEVCTKK